MLEKNKFLSNSNSFTYYFVKIGLFALGSIILFELGRQCGSFIKTFL